MMNLKKREHEGKHSVGSVVTWEESNILKLKVVTSEFIATTMRNLLSEIQNKLGTDKVNKGSLIHQRR